MLGALAHLRPEDRVKFKDMREFELERLMLHRLTELEEDVRQAYAAYDYRKVVAMLTHFMNSELSAFYFDIRKDALYCEPYSSVKRRAALTVIDEIFSAVVVWLAPILSFTAEEAWLAREPGREGSVHLETFPEPDKAWRNDELARKWEEVRRVRSVVTGALELERAAKRIGSSLEAAPEIYVEDTGHTERARRRRPCRGIDHERRPAHRQGAARGRLHAPRRAGCRRRAQTRRGAKVRALLAHPARRRRRSGVPGSFTARRRRRARVRRARERQPQMTQPAGARSWLWGPYSRLGLIVCVATLLTRPGAQVVDARSLPRR